MRVLRRNRAFFFCDVVSLIFFEIFGGFMKCKNKLKPCLWWILAKKQLFLAHETYLKKKKPPKLPKYSLKPLLVSKKLPDKNLKPRLVSQKLPQLQFRGGNRHQKAKLTNFKTWNFGGELFEINFRFWNVPKCQHFWILGHQFSCKSCC